AAAFANRSWSVVAKPSGASATFLQKSFPRAALKVSGSHSSKATICAEVDVFSGAAASVTAASVTQATIRASFAALFVMLFLPSVVFREGGADDRIGTLAYGSPVGLLLSRNLRFS